VTKDEYIAFLETKNKQYYKEIQQLTYEKGILQGRLKVFFQSYPKLGMELIPGGKYGELKQKGGVR
jgi:hypothetical protein